MPSWADVYAIDDGAFTNMFICEDLFVIFVFFELPTRIFVFVWQRGSFWWPVRIVCGRSMFAWSARNMGSDCRWECERKLACFDGALHVVKTHQIVIHIAPNGLHGAFGEPTINPGVDGGQDLGDEFVISGGERFVGDEVGSDGGEPRL